MLKQAMVKIYYRIKFPSTKFIGKNYLGKGNDFGKGSTIYEECRISKSRLGSYSYISSFSRINNAEIGSYCSIGPEVLIGLGMHPTSKFVSTHPSFFSTNKQSGIVYSQQSKFVETKRTLVGNDVWIGARAIILDGVTVGNGAIIGSNSVVTKDVPPYAVVGGVPAKVIKFRFQAEEIEQLLEIKWWNWNEDKLRMHADIFDDITIFLKDEINDL